MNSSNKFNNRSLQLPKNPKVGLITDIITSPILYDLKLSYFIHLYFLFKSKY